MVLRDIMRRILPNWIRVLVANCFYRMLSFHFNLRDQIKSLGVLRGILRGILPNRIRVLWYFSLSYCHLLNIKKSDLTIIQILQRSTLKVFFILADLFYRNYYTKFGKEAVQFSRQLDHSKDSGITLLTGSLGPGGAERQVVTTLLELKQDGHNSLSLICYSLRNETHRFFLPHLDNSDVHVSELERDSSNYPELIQLAKNLPLFSADVLDYIRSLYGNRPRIVHLWLDETNIKGGMAAVALGIPRIILGLRSLPPCNFLLHRPYFREGYRWLVKQPGVVLVNNSEAGARAYEKWLGLCKGSIQVVHNGFNFDSSVLSLHKENSESYRAKFNIPTTSPLFGTVIRLSEEKRPMLWLEIAAKVRKQLPSAHFLIVGHGHLYNALVARAEQDDLRGAVHFAGYEKVALSAIAVMDIFLLTSRAEGLPNVLVEAQALGVPVVTTNVGGAPETLMHGVTGWVLENDDSQSVANILVKLSLDEVWLKNVRKKAPQFVHNTFGVKRMIDEILKIYQIEPNAFNEVNNPNVKFKSRS